MSPSQPCVRSCPNRKSWPRRRSCARRRNSRMLDAAWRRSGKKNTKTGSRKTTTRLPPFEVTAGPKVPRHRCALRGFEMESALVILADCPYQERKSRVAGLRERRRVALCYVLLLAEWFLDVPGQDMKGCCFSYHVRQVCVVCSLLGRKRVCVCVGGRGGVYQGGNKH